MAASAEPPKRHKAVELRKASAGRLVQEISAVFVAAPLRVLELLFFSCLPVCDGSKMASSIMTPARIG